MKKTSIPRRQLLRGILSAGAAVAIPLPLLDCMLNGHGTALAQGGAVPTRYMTWFFGNGVIPALWVPAVTGSAWQLSPQLEPLAAFKDHLTVISGLGQYIDPGTHWGGAAAATTGSMIADSKVGAPSVDQLIADVIGTTTPFRSLELGVTDATPNEDGAITLHAVSHRGTDAPLRPEFNPQVIFNRLFATATPNGTGSAPSPLVGVKKSVLDAVLQDGQALRTRLGARDQQRLDSHLDGIRALESRLSAVAPVSCGAPNKPSVGRDVNEEATPAVNTAMTDLAVTALACGLTNVASYVFSLPAAHIYFRGLGSDMDADFHDTICHGDPGENVTQGYQTRVHKAVLFTMTCFAEMLQKMQWVQEGAGTLLDNSLVYVSTDVAWGKDHATQEYPVLFAGKAGGRLAGNLHVRETQGNLSQALFSAAHLMGSTIATLGTGGGLVNKGVTGI